MSFSASAHGNTTAPLKLCAVQAVSAGKAVGNFFYGDNTRTQRSLCFAYGCIALYMLAIINAGSFSACAM